MNARQKVKDLIELACDETGEDKERIAAGMKAVRLIRKYDLLASPLDGLLDSDNETVAAATDIFSHLTSPGFMSSVKKIGGQLGRVGAARKRRAR
jgi:hypothetical protein